MRVYSLLTTLALLPSLTTAAVVETQPKLQILKSTINANGDIIDWVTRESQGKLASPPPNHLLQRSELYNEKDLEAMIAPFERGPPGTVPVVRTSNSSTPFMAVPQKNREGSHRLTERGNMMGYAAMTEQKVSNLGGTGYFALWNPELRGPGDTSATLMSVSRTYYPDGGPVLQVIQTGLWATKKYPELFVLYTTNGYKRYGNDIGSLNTQYSGWKQYDDVIHPGIGWNTVSTHNGQQWELGLGFVYHENPWWVKCRGKWIGYFPGTLFAKYPEQGKYTLSSMGDTIAFYGYVWADSERPRSDMGSGEKAADYCGDKQYARTAYIRTIKITDTANNSIDYKPQNIWTTRPDPYTVSHSISPNSFYGSHVWLGGFGDDYHIQYPCTVER